MPAKFGTSGLRGLTEELVGRTSRRFVGAFARYLFANGLAADGHSVCVGWDFRASSPAIVEDAIAALTSQGLRPLLCGNVPTQALAFYAMQNGMASLMVTGSHIPADRNGIKFYLPDREISKVDEMAITALAEQETEKLDDYFGARVSTDNLELAVSSKFKQRCLQAFPPDCLRGLRVGVYQHSTVARDLLVQVLKSLGAEVIELGREEIFVPIDTEAVPTAVARQLNVWSDLHSLDAIVSADGDGDRPLFVDERGDVILGDVLGLITSKVLGAKVIVTPVTSNSGIDRVFEGHVVRTQVGSPYVICGMMEALSKGQRNVVGFEANGGFLTASTFEMSDGVLAALPTRDSFLPILAVLSYSVNLGIPLSSMVSQFSLPHTKAGRLENFSTDWSKQILDHLQESADNQDKFFDKLGKTSNADITDGLRVILQSGIVVHLRPSGNAPEFRIYVESSTPQSAEFVLSWCKDAILTLRDKLSLNTRS